MEIIRAAGLLLILLCWELNWRRYPANLALRWGLGFALFCWGVGGIPAFLLTYDVWRLLGLAALSWFTGGWTRRLFGAGPRYTWRLPSLTD